MADLTADEVLAYVAANVRKFRERRGLSQAKLAEAAHMDATYVPKIEGEQLNISVAVLVRLAVALGVSPSTLLRKTRPAPRRAPGRPRRRAAQR